MLKICNLFNLSQTLACGLLKDCVYPWEALPQINAFILSLKGKLDREYVEVLPNVFVHKTAKVAASAQINGPCVIGAGTEVRHCAFIRGGAVIGENCVVGNSTEVKNSILFNGVQVPHFNYIGDSILGFKAHLGAGAITSNVKSAKTPVTIDFEGTKVFTDLKKFGAAVGDFCEVGCNCVLNPGSVIGKNSVVYPLSSVRGVVPPNSIYKSPNQIIAKKP